MGLYLCCPQHTDKVTSIYAPVAKRSRKVPLKLSSGEKAVLIKHWEATVLHHVPDIFLKTMLASIRDSPRLLDIISCKMYHPNFEDISEWPKLRRMANGNCAFFTKQIVTNKLDEDLVRKDSEQLGAIHIQYAPYGFKPTFLDIWQANMLSIVEQIEFEKAHDKKVFLKAFRSLISFLCTLMVMEYEDSMQLIRHTEREYRRDELINGML
ncbi:hypothetical protein L596_021055 [Steinernema carpocapsae]|uniref:Globin family profile domain-containing protein n=1 Tax=Steinernema carpocapsae TaxID=34508 RepID=A0A4U5MVK5_STECR|nr:hypothetical protein L596_021055 [Steinernema carpocapsae]